MRPQSRCVRVALRRWRVVLAGTVVGVTLSGCIYDAGPVRAQLFNERDEAVVVQITGTDRVIELAPLRGIILRDEVCVGDGVVITTEDGTELTFEGAVCPSTTVQLFPDGRIVVVDDGEPREPVSTTSPTPSQP